MEYTVSQAASQLLVKRNSLLHFERLQPELAHCALRSGGWRYNEKEMTLLRDKLLEVYKKGKTLEQYLAECEQSPDTATEPPTTPSQTQNSKPDNTKKVESKNPAASTRKAHSTPKPRSSKTIQTSATATTSSNTSKAKAKRTATKVIVAAPKTTHTRKTRLLNEIAAASEQVDNSLWYSNKLYDESQGQSSFGFITTNISASTQPDDQVADTPMTVPANAGEDQSVNKAASETLKGTLPDTQPTNSLAELPHSPGVFAKLTQLEQIARNPVRLKRERESLFDILITPK